MKSAYHLIRTSVGSAPECNTIILIHNLVESTQSYILVQLKKKNVHGNNTNFSSLIRHDNMYNKTFKAILNRRTRSFQIQF